MTKWTKRTLLLASSTLFAAQPVWAQDMNGQDAGAQAQGSPTDAGGDVVVTGYRTSLAQARNSKRDATIIKDSISASDIAAFPDLNLAEALQRLPGVAINREAGEGRRISLRGLGPDFTRVQLDECVEAGLNLSPAVRVHRSGSPLSSSASHARAERSSRLAVASDTPIAAALSSSDNPPK